MSASVARVRFGPLWQLAMRELWHERWLSWCSACVLAATLAPLWTLWSIERGVVGTIVERQNQDPAMRLLVPVASRTYDDAWFAMARNWPEVAFVVPNTRRSAALVNVLNDAEGVLVSLELDATGRGDPLLGSLPVPQGNDAVLTARAAQQLKARVGQVLNVSYNLASGPVGLPLTVRHILPVAATGEARALIALPLLVDIRTSRDVAAGEAGAAGRPTQPMDQFRMYATDIHQVQPLAERLEKIGVSVRTEAQQIASTLGLQDNLRAVFSMVGVIATAGAVLALLALQAATLRRKRRDHALLKLVGYGRGWLIGLPTLHALVTACVGAGLALLIYLAASSAINAHFIDHMGQGESAAILYPIDVAWGLLAAIVVSVLPALWGGWRASLVEAADELREI